MATTQAPVHRQFYSLPQSSDLIVDASNKDQLEDSKQTEDKNYKGESLLGYIAQNVVGADKTFSGPYGLRKVTYLDYVASGRALHFIEDYIKSEVLPDYGNTHTTTSVTSLQTTLFRHEARDLLRNSFNASEHDSVIFTGSGATGAVHKLVHALDLNDNPPIVLVGPFEHHSNFLPWKESGAKIIRIQQTKTGQVDMKNLEETLVTYKGSSRQLIGAFSAASNITGVVCDVNAITVCLHRHGALAVWDYACGGPYLNVDMNPYIGGADQPYVYKDAVFLSMHKFVGGTSTPGVLVAKKKLFRNRVPHGGGGGTVFFVRRSSHRYLQEPEMREEGGTPAIVQSIRAGLVVQLKQAVGVDLIQARDVHLRRQAGEAWAGLPNLVLLGNPPTNISDTHMPDKLPIFSFMVRHPETGRFLHHNFVTAVLNDVFGIQARGGCACAGPLAMDLLGISEEDAQAIEELIAEDSRLDRTHLRRVGEYSHREMIRPGFVRLNLPFFADAACVQFVLEAVKLVAQHAWKLLPQYLLNPETAEWRHRNFQTFKDRKWLGHISYGSGEMKYQLPKQVVKGPLPTDYQDCLSKAEKIFADAEKLRLKVPVLSFLFDEATQPYRWFVLPCEAYQSLQPSQARVNISTVTPDSLPIYPGRPVQYQGLERSASNSSGSRFSEKDKIVVGERKDNYTDPNNRVSYFTGKQEVENVDNTSAQENSESGGDIENRRGDSRQVEDGQPNMLPSQKRGGLFALQEALSRADEILGDSASNNPAVAEVSNMMSCIWNRFEPSASEHGNVKSSNTGASASAVDEVKDGMAQIWGMFNGGQTEGQGKQQVSQVSKEMNNTSEQHTSAVTDDDIIEERRCNSSQEEDGKPNIVSPKRRDGMFALQEALSYADEILGSQKSPNPVDVEVGGAMSSIQNSIDSSACSQGKVKSSDTKTSVSAIDEVKDSMAKIWEMCNKGKSEGEGQVSVVDQAGDRSSTGRENHIGEVGNQQRISEENESEKLPESKIVTSLHPQTSSVPTLDKIGENMKSESGKNSLPVSASEEIKNTLNNIWDSLSFGKVESNVENRDTDQTGCDSNRILSNKKLQAEISSQSANTTSSTQQLNNEINNENTAVEDIKKAMDRIWEAFTPAKHNITNTGNISGSTDSHITKKKMSNGKCLNVQSENVKTNGIIENVHEKNCYTISSKSSSFSAGMIADLSKGFIAYSSDDEVAISERKENGQSSIDVSKSNVIHHDYQSSSPTPSSNSMDVGSQEFHVQNVENDKSSNNTNPPSVPYHQDLTPSSDQIASPLNKAQKVISNQDISKSASVEMQDGATSSTSSATPLGIQDVTTATACPLMNRSKGNKQEQPVETPVKWFAPSKQIFKPSVTALEEYSMLKDGDRVLVCLSGGKDSLSLLHTIRQYQFYARGKGINFEFGAVTIDPMTPAYDPSPLKAYLASLGVPYFYESQCILETAEQLPYECASICSFCSRMKRGRIYATARREGYNVLALGQHLDDLAESFLMSFFHNGCLNTMKAHYTIKQGDLRVIRPFVYVREADLRAFAEQRKLPVIAENCPACFEAPKERHRTKQLLAAQEVMFPQVYSSMMAALKPLMAKGVSGGSSSNDGASSKATMAENIGSGDAS